MSLTDFEAELRAELARLDFISNINIRQRTPISIQGTVSLSKSYALVIFYNHQFNILSFSLIYSNKRILGIDRDNRIGWHIHPF